MAIDSPAKIAVLGAGPIGLEAALYARFLGYDVEVFDRGAVAENVRRWGHVSMFSPFGQNRSSLGLAALAAQDTGYQPPGDDELLTGHQWIDRYLLPLSQTDLLADHLRLGANVVAVGRENLLKSDAPGSETRAESPLLILVEDNEGAQRTVTADAVIDATGVFANPNWLGRGGIPAVGETRWRSKIEYGLPELNGEQRGLYAGKRVLLVGGGYSAATNAAALNEIARDASQTHVTWITRKPPGADGPIAQIAGDRLPARSALAAQANAAAGGGHIEHWGETSVAAISMADDQFEVELVGAHTGVFRFDRVIANVGCHPDNRIYHELQVHECFATEGPMKLSAALLGDNSVDCLDQTAHGAASLLNPEPNFYILGAKSYGRNSQFLASVGLEQIRELFTIIGGREGLDLYKGAKSLPT